MPIKTQKLTPWQIKKIIAKGLQWRGQYFTVRYSRVMGKPLFAVRIAVVISKKTLAQAHERNLCRRRVKAAFSQSIGELVGFNLIVFPTKLALEANYDKLLVEVKTCLNALL